MTRTLFHTGQAERALTARHRVVPSVLGRVETIRPLRRIVGVPLRPGWVRLGQVRPAQGRRGQVRLGQVRRDQVSQGQDGPDQGRFGQFRPTQVRLGQGRFGQVSAAKREPGEVLPRHHDTLEVHHVQRLL